MPKLTQLFIYPIKALGGIELTESVVERRGLQYDRRRMLVDTNGQFASQRNLPQLALLGTSINSGILSVFIKKDPKKKIDIELDWCPEDTCEVQIWKDQLKAFVYPDAINSWFSEFTGQALRLVYMPDSLERQADREYAPEGQFVSFADGFPYLIISQASLEDLNQRLAEPVPMNRFRPNLVVEDTQPFEEDTWGSIQIGNIPFDVVKPCARCPVPTTDQETGQRSPEPLKTLAGFRKRNNKVYFGQNAIWTGSGTQTIQIGSEIKIV